MMQLFERLRGMTLKVHEDKKNVTSGSKDEILVEIQYKGLISMCVVEDDKTDSEMLEEIDRFATLLIKENGE